MITADGHYYKSGDRLFEVGQYSNKEWYIIPHIVNKNNHMFSSSKYFAMHHKGRQYIKNKKASTIK